MNLKRAQLLLVGFLVLILGGGLLWAQTPADAKARASDAILLTVEGKVEVARTGSSVWRAGATNQTLQVGDRLRTGIRSRATVRLSNLSVLRVNELTTLQIQPPTAPGKQAQLNLESGASYFLSRERPTETEFRTPLASGAIRGTEFHLAVGPDGQTVVTLIDGAIALSNEHGGLELASGEAATVAPGQAPTKTAALYTMNTIQWCLYYPAVLNVEDELPLSADEKAALAASLQAYRAGDLLQALSAYPEARPPASEAEKIYFAALNLAVGQVAAAEGQLAGVKSPLGQPLRQMVAVTKHENPPGVAPRNSSDWLAESYRLQSANALAEARAAARQAVAIAPQFGFAWARLAELEFSFGRIPEALGALNRALQLSPRDAQAVALKGFLLAAQNHIPAARAQFEQAIALDGALGNAWLGRGLVRIRAGDANGGRQDLQVAATLEPQRALLRSYLGKAFANANDPKHALRELALARKLDPGDPTAWLYAALLNQQENEINQAVDDLEKSKARNENRSLYRSRLLLDQDRAVRSANLAQVYRDDGMETWSVSEAGRALNADYANYSAHLFLAESFDALRDPKQINLRYETPWFTELLLSQLLAPVGAGNLSQYVSQQEYSKLFTRDGLGLSSSTEYQSRGAWFERASQFGTFGDTSYAVDVEYRSDPGQRPNNDTVQSTVYAKIKEQITPQDSVFFGALFYDTDFGDLQQYYSDAGLRPQLRLSENQTPNLFLGYHHEWSPGAHTLLLLSRLDDTLSLSDSNAAVRFLRYGIVSHAPVSFASALADREIYSRDFEAYSAELQHIQQFGAHTLVAGGRYQSGWVDMRAELDSPFAPLTMQDTHSQLHRYTAYAYDQWQVLDPFLLVGGVSYDRLEFPKNVDTPPLDATETSRSLVSPKVGFIWNVWREAHLRGAYTRSLGGLSYDNSVRIEPSQVAGFNQAFRSLAPEAVAGLVPGAQFETYGLAFDQAIKRTQTYLSIEADWLNSHAARTVGMLTNSVSPVADSASGTLQTVDYEERTLAFTVNQLLGREVSAGARYAISDAEFAGHYVQAPTALANAAGANQNSEAVLQQLTLFTLLNHPCGFFSRAEAIWSRQDNQRGLAGLPGEDFWQFNLFAGYRFAHRKAELRLGLLNLGNQDYHLNPVTLYNDLPRQRTLSVAFKFYF